MIRMNSVITLLTSVFLLLSCEVQNADDGKNKISEEEVQIAKNLIQGAFDDLWAGLDSTKISTYHTDDFVILEQGQVWDNERIKKYMRNRLDVPNKAKRVNRMNYLSIDKYGESIQIAYYNDADFLQSDTIVRKLQWLESAVAVFTKEGWRLKMMHSTRVKQK